MREKEVFGGDSQQILTYVKKAILPGVGGYILFLWILVFTKWIATFIHPEEALKLSTYDFVLPSIGFVIPFLIKFLENFKQEQTDNF